MQVVWIFVILMIYLFGSEVEAGAPSRYRLESIISAADIIFVGRVTSAYLEDDHELGVGSIINYEIKVHKNILNSENKL